MISWLLDLLLGWFTQHLGGIIAGFGAAIAAIFAYFKGRKDQAQKGKIAVQKETIDAYKDRNDVEDRIRRAKPDEFDRLQQPWLRDD